jgi:hypothetical protein
MKCSDKDGEIDHRKCNYAKGNRIVELEFDLETHDVHYTSYVATVQSW